MSSHRRSTQHFARDFGAKKALLRGLMSSLVEHGRIRTTVQKAKEVQRRVEKIITTGKKGDLNTYRVLLSKIPNQDTITKIMKDVSVRFKERPGGYTRVIKLGPRPGDMAEMAYLEFVDFDYSQFLKSSTKKGEGKKADAADKVKQKDDKKAAKKRVAAVAAARKSRRKMQNKSRAESRLTR